MTTITSEETPRARFSDTVLRAFERWDQYRLGTNIRAWL